MKFTEKGVIGEVTYTGSQQCSHGTSIDAKKLTWLVANIDFVNHLRFDIELSRAKGNLLRIRVHFHFFYFCHAAASPPST